MKFQGTLSVLAFALLAECGATNAAMDGIGSKLVQTARDGDLETLKGLLEMGIWNDELAARMSDEIGEALCIAVENKNLEMAKCLLETGAWNAVLVEGLSYGIMNAVFQAAMNGDLEAIKCLIETVVGTKNDRLIEVLSGGIVDALVGVAALNRDLEMIKCLVESAIGTGNDRLLEGLSAGIADALYHAALKGNLGMVKYCGNRNGKRQADRGTTTWNRKCTGQSNWQWKLGNHEVSDKYGSRKR